MESHGEDGPLDGAQLDTHRTRDSVSSMPPAREVQSHVSKPQSLIRETIFVSIICLAQLMTQAGLGQAIAPLHIIGSSFGTSTPGQLSWYAAAYSLTVGTFILIAGRLGDVYGHKNFFVAGFLWYGVWSLLAGFSVYSTQIFFDCCRALQGIGPACMLPNAIAILGRVYEPGRRKEMVFSIFGATAPGGFVIGAVFSSLFAQWVWWPWAYWVMGIFCFVIGAAAVIIIPNTPPPVHDKSISMLSRVDTAGSVSIIAGLVLINFAWNQGPVVGWHVPYNYILLIVGFLCVGLFFVIESRARFPLLPFDALNRDTGFVLGCVATGWSSFGIWVFYLWQLQEELRGHSPLLTTAMMSPAAISGLCAALVTGVVLSRIPASMVMLIALLAFLTGSILLATAPVHQSYWLQTFFSIIITPWGM